jgi:hypothetical protein
LVSIIDFLSGKMDCEACKQKGTKPPGKMHYTGKRAVMEPEGDFWRFTEYEMQCDVCGAIMSSQGAGPRPGIIWSIKKDTIGKI